MEAVTKIERCRTGLKMDGGKTISKT